MESGKDKKDQKLPLIDKINKENQRRSESSLSNNSQVGKKESEKVNSGSSKRQSLLLNEIRILSPKPDNKNTLKPRNYSRENSLESLERTKDKKQSKQNSMAIVKNNSNSNLFSISTNGRMTNGCPFKAMNLHSFSNEKSYAENLHHQAALPPNMAKCTATVCKGSILKTGILKLNQVKNIDEARAENNDFINQYYKHLNKIGSDEHTNRLIQSYGNFFKFGRFELTKDELEFAVKTAWRNASRCIGRINWSKIQLFDGRNVTTTNDMFKLLCEHIKYATNNGNLRSAATVFRQRIDGKCDFRIWNAQIINYAGYQISETETVGDKSQIEFTKICLKLGWKGKKTEFDVLPLILQADGKDPELFELPEDLVLQVELTHPKYEAFNSLKLKWFAVPGVSSMALDAGGIFFNAVQFNGWYMSTEIVRDLLEPNRYNKLEIIAKTFGFDTNSSLQFWKDETLLELNKAIMYSFNKAGVTIVDHHSAAESFAKHFENEIKLRGGTPADWVWINPPTASHITPLFGLEMLNYNLKPYFEYQEAPSLPKRLIKFKTVAKCIMPFLQSCFKKINKRKKCLVLYASQTGKAKSYADITNNLFKNMFQTKIMSLNEYNLNDLENENLVLIIASTTGNGEAPTNGQKIEQIALDVKNKTIRDESKKSIEKRYKNVRFSILGLGDTLYHDNFCAFPKLIEAFLLNLNLKQLRPTSFADQSNEEEKTCFDWIRQCILTAFKKYQKDLNMKQEEIEHILNSKEIKKNKLKIKSYPLKSKEFNSNDLLENLSKINEKPLIKFEIIEKEEIGTQPQGEKIFRIKLRSNERDIFYKPGDHIEIFGQNYKHYVDFILSRLDNSADFDQPIKFEIYDDKLSTANNELWLTDKRFPVMSIREALTYYFDITTPLSQDALKMLSTQALNAADKIELLKLSENLNAYQNWKAEYPNLVDVLKTHFSVNPDINLLLAELPKMKPRYYSISSTQKVTKNEVEITLGVFENESSKYKSIHYGVCTKWLEMANLGTMIPCGIKNGNKFELPSDQTLPIIMICGGTGIAPFRGFWQDREKDLERKNKSSLGDMYLFFGCRDSKKDFLYNKELTNMVLKKVIKCIYPAFSRDQDKPKEYVQDKLKENSSLISDLILNKKANIYVCGKKRLADGVKEEIINILKKSELLNTGEEALKFLQEMKSKNTYHEDIFN